MKTKKQIIKEFEDFKRKVNEQIPCSLDCSLHNVQEDIIEIMNKNGNN